MSQPPLFEGEPEKCSLCGVKGHTHDEHWLYNDIEALQRRVLELEGLVQRLSRMVSLLDERTIGMAKFR